MKTDADGSDATQLLSRLSEGDGSAAEELLALVYRELRAVAGKQFAGQASGHTLQPTALVHEAFLKMIGGGATYNDRAHFMAVAATAMRQILVNHARDRAAQKRGGGHKPVVLDEALVVSNVETAGDVNLLDLNAALDELEQIDPRKRKVVEMRFFAGLTVPEVAEAMKMSVTTIEAEWRAARAWLAVRLK